MFSSYIISLTVGLVSHCFASLCPMLKKLTPLPWPFPWVTRDWRCIRVSEHLLQFALHWELCEVSSDGSQKILFTPDFWKRWGVGMLPVRGNDPEPLSSGLKEWSTAGGVVGRHAYKTVLCKSAWRASCEGCRLALYTNRWLPDSLILSSQPECFFLLRRLNLFTSSLFLSLCFESCFILCFFYHYCTFIYRVVLVTPYTSIYMQYSISYHFDQASDPFKVVFSKEPSLQKDFSKMALNQQDRNDPWRVCCCSTSTR